MSFKQDRTGARTPADLERKYMFGKSFAEVYALAEDAKTAADKASEAVGNLDSSLSHEEIFNRLTNYGAWQGVYRDGENIYMNASYIKSGTLAATYIDADNLKVKAANITGTLEASQIDANNLKVNAANIVGTLEAGQINTTFLTVSAANITGQLTASQIDVSQLYVNAANISGLLSASQIDATNLSVSAANITGQLTAAQINTTNLSVNAANVSGTLYSTNVSISGALAIVGGGAIGYVSGVSPSGATSGIGVKDPTGVHSLVATTGGAKIASNTSEVVAAVNITLTTNNAINANKSITVTSDRRAKDDIQYNVDDYLTVFDDLKPCTFVWLEGNDKRKQFGMIAQDVEENLERNGVKKCDFAPLSIDEAGRYGLSYEGFIALLIAKVHQLDAEVKELKNNG